MDESTEAQPTMTDEQLNKNRNEIVKKYFNFFGILNLEDDLGISISSSRAGIYHVFSNKENILTHEYSVGEKELEKIAASLKIHTIKRLFVDAKLKSYTDKLTTKYQRPPEAINPMDHENLS